MSDDNFASAAPESPASRALAPGGRLTAGIALALILVTALVYGRVLGADFVNYDDGEYLYENPYLQSGLDLDTLTWAATTNYASNWHPLTWLSHALDVQLFGLDAGAHHAVNLLFHCANTALLFLFLFQATHSTWRSAFVAALFALHPLHVESVAWIAERKDVLSTFFWFLTMLAYLRYTRAPGVARYLLVVASFTLGLMSKSMLVTLPLVLVLLDYWPLQRMALTPGALGKSVFEKLPLLLLSAGCAALTYWAQDTRGSVMGLESYAFGLRVANALVAYVSYIGNLFWPVGLGVFYPHPLEIPLWRTLLASALLLAASAYACAQIKRRPYWIVGWLWFVGTLVPVIGLVQVGRQAMADRYTYVPLVGLFVALAWGLGEWAQRRPKHRKPLIAAAVGSLLACAALTGQQVGHWQNGIALYRHTLSVTENNYLAHAKLAEAQADLGLGAEAVESFRLALRIHPHFANAHLNLGAALWGLGRHEQALAHFEEAVRLDASLVAAHVNLATAYQQLGRGEEAIAHYTEALRLDPKNLLGHFNFGQTLFSLGHMEEAIAQLRMALSIDPNHAMSHNSLGAALATRGEAEAGLEHFRRAAELDPANPMAFNNLGLMLSSMGDTTGAIRAFEQALRVRPDFADARENLRRARESATP